MKTDVQLKLQAYLDGELTAAEAGEVTEWLARDEAARDLFGELTATRNAVRGNEVEVTLPENTRSEIEASTVNGRISTDLPLVVKEVNTPPFLPIQSNLFIDELTLLTVTNTATDADLPANTLTFAFLAAPTNATISAIGVIAWTPT